MIAKPLKEDYPEYYHTYVRKVETEDLISGLEDEMETTLELLSSLDDEKVNFRYAEGKWSLKEVMIHVLDAERVFAYRALRFGRHDLTALEGFDQDEYGRQVNGTSRSIESVLEEYQAVRLSSIRLFESFGKEDLEMKGVASGAEVSVRSLGYIILGHNIHHREGLQTNYL